jgi:multicomponent Na+:H+ antiporter subunit E
MRRALGTVVMFAFWLVISGSLKPFDLALGALLAIAIGWWADRVLWRDEAPPLSGRGWLRLPGYFVYLFREIIVAALYVAERVLDPRLDIAPTIHTHRVRFRSETARVAFANSITLTPGTLTVDVEDDVFVIHCLHPSFSDTISSGDLERRVTRTFDE